MLIFFACAFRYVKLKHKFEFRIKNSEKNKANSYSWAESNQLNHLSTHLLGPLSPIARPSFFPIAAPVLTYMWVPPGSRMALGWHGLNR